MESVLDKCLTPTQEMIVNLMEIENANINTMHPDFVGAADCLLNLFADESNNQNAIEENQDGEEPEKLYSLLTKRKPTDSETGSQLKLVDQQQSQKSEAPLTKSKLTEKQLEMS